MSSPIEVPPHLAAEVQSGNVAIMLGAGASFGTVNQAGQHPPLAAELGKRLTQRFLPSGFEKYPLAQIAEYAIGETDLLTVQRYVAEQYTGFTPSETHKLLPAFRWKAIITTNYDQLIEDGYSQANGPAQRLVPFIDNNDRIDERLRDANDVLLLKLHGCLTRINNPSCPLILSTDQYIRYRKGRSLLFNKFKEIASGRPILYIGYSLQDPNILQILQEMEDEEIARPTHYLVTPGVTEIDKRHWARRKVTAIAATFDSFMAALDQATASPFRRVAVSTGTAQHPISSRFTKSGGTLSKNTLQFLDNDAEYVNALPAQPLIDPKLFYKGNNTGWSAIEQKLDVQRHLTSTILADYVVDAKTDDTGVKLVVVKAPAGAGKTVLLQRLAWDAAKEFNSLCLFMRPNGVVYPQAVAEICELCSEPVFLFTDNIPDRRREIDRLFESLKNLPYNVTVIGAARTNEWNQSPDSLTRLATDEYDLLHLSRKEINGLLRLLEANKALGTLEQMKPEERLKLFDELSGRQLLVALHEATLGKPFQEIVADECRRITPDKARLIYLSICLLNQFSVPVRAGIISRRYGVPFEKFRDEFFAPLEQVILTHQDSISRDMCYTARHPHIAQLVVETAFANREDLFNEVIQAVQYLNPAYHSDRVAFRKLLNGRTVRTTFPDHQMAVRLFQTARTTAGDDPVLIQQQAIYEMNRPDGNLNVAESLLAKAHDLAKTNRSIIHSQAELLVRRAEAAKHRVEREKHLADATEICRGLKSRKDDPLPYYTLIKIGVMRIEAAQNDPDVHDQTIENLTRDTERLLDEAKQRFPNHASLYSAEAELHNCLSRGTRAMAALRKAFDLNPRNGSIAIRLADDERRKGDLDAAVGILKKAIEAKDDRRVRYSLARMMYESRKGTPEEITYHLERSYAPNDDNYSAQFLHACQLFAVGQSDKARTLFRKLQRSGVTMHEKYGIHFPLPDQFTGAVQRLEASYCFISRDGDSELIYCPRSEFSDELWDTITYGSRMTFQIGFNIKGPTAYRVSLL